ncbi:SMI1/KNR4 family protein [Micromonospora rosaria]|uniref:SMI1/KNR4 family protein n=1 Tax=Micromonospora rosaria TaxID=47874 RepID=UPI0012F86F47
MAEPTQFARESLTSLVSPPRSSPAHADWARVESKMGTALPADYKWLIDQFGQGIFGDFLHIFHPESDPKALELEYQHERATWALEYLLNRGHDFRDCLLSSCPLVVRIMVTSCTGSKIRYGRPTVGVLAWVRREGQSGKSSMGVPWSGLNRYSPRRSA